MLSYARKAWNWGMNFFPRQGFHFDRPLVLFQSDDWGRVGLRDHEGLEQLRSAGLTLGERPNDFYTLETAEDLAALSGLLKRHSDSAGRHPTVQMNFILDNLDFAQMSITGFQQIRLLPLADGLPYGWNRPGLIAGYRAGITDGVFHPALHGTTHFCRSAVERHLAAESSGASSDRLDILRKLWQAGTPYIHWRMPWIGYEYWDPELPKDQRFLAAETQRELIGQTVGAFAKLFRTLPRSACAPGYRANDDTHHAWAQHGIRVAQNGPGLLAPPYFDRHEILQLSRTVEFEPAVDANFSIETCQRQAETCFEQGIPVVVAVHSINFHSTVKDFCSRTLKFLDEFLTALESKHPDLRYLHDEELFDLVSKGQSPRGGPPVNVTRKNFTKAELAHKRKA